MKVNTGLTRTIELLSEKKTASEIAREMKVSRVSVHKKIKRMLSDGLITESPESTPNLKFYRVNQILTLSEKGLTRGIYHLLFDPHNYALKFKIVPDGQGVPFETKVRKRNWDAQYLDHNMVCFEKTTKHLIGSLGDRVKFQISSSSDVEKIKSMIHSIIVQEAIKVVDEYDMKVDLNHPVVCRKELGVIDPMIEPNDMRIHSQDWKKVYPDKIEFHDEHALKTYVDNRVVENGSDDIKGMINGLRDELRGSLNTQNAIANSQLMIATLLKTLVSRKPIRKVRKVVQNSLRRFLK